ncbi:MAG TPA: hypothetical protein VFZ07_13365, partial [Dongiaceae bacterium]
AAEGIDVDLAYLFEHCLGRSFATVAETVTQYSGRDLPREFEARYREALLQRFETELRPMPGAADVLLLVVGDKSANDEVTYPDIDMHGRLGADGKFSFTRKDGSSF